MKNQTITLKNENNTFDTVNYSDITKLTKWNNIYGNPSFGIYLSNGNKYITIDNYEICPSYCDCNTTYVKRKKDL